MWIYPRLLYCFPASVSNLATNVIHSCLVSITARFLTPADITLFLMYKENQKGSGAKSYIRLLDIWGNARILVTNRFLPCAARLRHFRLIYTRKWGAARPPTLAIIPTRLYIFASWWDLWYRISIEKIREKKTNSGKPIKQKSSVSQRHTESIRLLLCK